MTRKSQILCNLFGSCHQLSYGVLIIKTGPHERRDIYLLFSDIPIYIEVPIYVPIYEVHVVSKQ